MFRSVKRFDLKHRYVTGNNWGMCPNGTGLVGCGPQEEFRACADVAIVDSTGAADETPFDNEIETDEVPTKDDQTPSHDQVEAEWWFLLVVIVLATLFTVLATFYIMYFYFYKREKLKEWWEHKQISIISHNPQGKQFHFWRTFKDSSRFKFWRTNSVESEKEKNYTIPQPVPPPRTKRLSKI